MITVVGLALATLIVEASHLLCWPSEITAPTWSKEGTAAVSSGEPLVVKLQINGHSPFFNSRRRFRRGTDG